MKLEEFYIGLEFYSSGASESSKYRCTVVGSRVAVARLMETAADRAM